MRTATELRGEILQAAGAEFAQYGLAGARIDRIARVAQASKERLYAHFRDKETLFREVVAAGNREFFSAVTLRPDAVPDFVGGIYDLAREHPEHHRMISWASWRASHSTNPTPRANLPSLSMSRPSKPPRPTATSTAPGSLTTC